jgi:spore germination cell wall hydrolase CwlJ-like protein
MNLKDRWPTLSAACCLVLLAAIVAVGPVRAEAAGGAEIPRVMGRDNPALTSVARGAEAVRTAFRPRARDVTVASRSFESAAESSGPAKLDLAALDAIPRGDDWRCLAEAIYFESRGEPLAGQIAVAEVVLNRVDDRRFPNSVCGVTTQGAGSGRGCQFSYACDGRSDDMKSSAARDRSEKLASVMLAGRPRTVTEGATYFHTRSVRPSWARKMARTTSIGHHHFYRPATRVASN